VITGTSGNDVIHVYPGSTPSTLTISFNGVITTHAKPTGRIIIAAGDGDDSVLLNGSIDGPAWVYGEAGNDKLNVGNVGPHGNLIIGGDGNDELSGGSGRDTMVGGQGADRIIGNTGDDILIAGYTIKDNRTDANHENFWCDILHEWTSTNSFENRVLNLQGSPSTETGSNGTSYLNVATVWDDDSVDHIDLLVGSAGEDWFLQRADEDTVAGASAIEQQFDMELLP
jgi:Ca2+-binding RTX toxin-like protein